MRKYLWLAAPWCAPGLFAAAITLDTSGYQPGPIAMESTAGAVTLRWKDESERKWSATFSLDSTKPPITAIAFEGRDVVTGARPFYRCETGKRRGGFDAFFDFPPSHPDGTRSFLGEFHPKNASVRSIGTRVEIVFDGMSCGIFQGSLHYIFYPGSRLIEQQASMSTSEPDTAYFYDAGLRMTAAADATPGGTMNSQVSYFDTKGEFHTIAPAHASERLPVAVRYRAVAAKTGAGSVVVFPAPHQYFFARDYTSNMGYLWYNAWRGAISLGIRQLPDDNSPYYPWMNAPPGSEQQMRMFFSVSGGDARGALESVLRYTHRDRYPKLPGYVTFAPHWHLAYTLQARDHGFDWEPPFKPAMKAIGLDAAMIMDFHGDGHANDSGGVRLAELQDYFRACHEQSGNGFLLMPSEEANVFLGGHWALVFPKPVYWHMNRQPGQPLMTEDPKYGIVYNTGSAQDVWEMVRREHGYVYQTHPRTKGSTGYPDAIKDTDYFRDSRYLGSGWKAMPSDLSSPRLGERAFKTVDDMNNLGFKKRMIGEVDVFQLDTTHELYAHMNVNYVRLPALPSYDRYGELLDALAQGEYFISAGEIVMPDYTLTGKGDSITASVSVDYTFPLRMAEIVWGDGTETHHHTIPLEETQEFRSARFQWQADAKDWKWARLAIWDVAGDGAFTNPVWRAD